MIKRTSHSLRHDPSRVIAKPYLPGEEIFTDTGTRAGLLMARILALRVESAANLGAYMTHVGPHIPTNGLRVMGGVYRVPIVYARVRGYFTNTSTVTSYRGAGRPEAIYVTERLMDQAAKAFGMNDYAFAPLPANEEWKPL